MSQEVLSKLRHQVHTIQLRDACLRQDNTKLQRQLEELKRTFKSNQEVIQQLQTSREKDAEILLQQEQDIARINNQPKDLLHLEELQAENEHLQNVFKICSEYLAANPLQKRKLKEKDALNALIKTGLGRMFGQLGGMKTEAVSKGLDLQYTNSQTVELLKKEMEFLDTRLQERDAEHEALLNKHKREISVLIEENRMLEAQLKSLEEAVVNDQKRIADLERKIVGGGFEVKAEEKANDILDKLNSKLLLAASNK